jgi:hypothetical protein
MNGLGFRTYACAARTRYGPVACDGLSISGPRLDACVKSFIQERLLRTRYLAKSLEGLIDRHRKLFDEFDRQANEFSSIADEAGKRVIRQLRAVEEGPLHNDEFSIQERIAMLQKSRDEHLHAAERARQRRNLFAKTITLSDDLARIVFETREKLQSDAVSYRHFAKLIFDQIKVTEDKIIITGSKPRLLAVLTGDSHRAENRLEISRRAKAGPGDRFRFTMLHRLKSRRKIRDA